MQHQSVIKLASVLLVSFVLSLSTACSEQVPEVSASDKAGDNATALGDVIARVGDQAITFNEINTMLNSSAVVGVSIPALGTPERDTARIVLLDKIISANLLYLDARSKGLDKDPEYLRAMRSFSDGILGGQYRQRIVAGDIPVSDQEIQAFFDKTMKPDTEITDDLRLQIEATLRKRKLHERLAAQRTTLREGVNIEVFPDKLATTANAQADQVVVAKYGDNVVTWGEVKTELIAAGRGAAALDPLAMEADAQLAALQALIDKRIIADKARAEGLENDPLYRARYNEFQKTRLVNLHRARLATQMEPGEEQLRAYYLANRNSIMQMEMRKVQEVLLPSREEAQAMKERIGSGEITMFQAAAEHSIAPGAKQNLGEVGWVAQGRAQPALNKVIFELEPDEVGGPVESTEGWHLFKVLDVSDARFETFEDDETHRLTRRRYIHDQLDNYVMDLRKNEFTVEVYEDNMVRLAQQEADMIVRLNQEAAKPGSITEQRLEELNKLVEE